MANASVELPCPGCGFLMYGPEAYGSFDTCPLCEWEDCAVQLANPLDGGGPNRESLVVHQARALERWPPGVQTLVDRGETYVRDPRWRPLSAVEIAYFRSRTEDGKRLAFNGISKLAECYWIATNLPKPAPPHRIQYEKLNVIGPALIEGKYFRVIDFTIRGGGHGLASQVWSEGRWMPGETPGCPRIMAAAPAPADELARAGVDCTPLGENYDPMSVECDHTTA